MTPRLGVETLESRDVPSTASFVTHMYQDLLGRNPDSGGFVDWVTAIDSGAISRARAADSFLNSTEFRAKLITSYYQNILGRAPDAAGFNDYMNQLAAGVTRDALQASFFGSEEFYNRVGRNPSNFVSQLYLQILGRAASGPEVALWTNALAQTNGNRYAVAVQFLTSLEYKQDEVVSAYSVFLHRQPDVQGFNDWTAARSFGLSVETMSVFFMASDEYFVRL